jgi:hypothetical protein
MTAIRWPSYSGALTPNMAKTVGVIVEQWNSLEGVIESLLLTYLDPDIVLGHIVTNELGNVPMVNAIKTYVHAFEKRPEIVAEIEFLLRAFDVCRINRNNIIHFRQAWRKDKGRKTHLLRFRARGQRVSFRAIVGVKELRSIADEMHALYRYGDELSVAIHKPYLKRPRKFKGLARPPMPKSLNWEKHSWD